MVVDGDTLNFNGTYVRLWGIDAPELRQTCILNNQSYFCGQKAKHILAELINYQLITCDILNKDRYGRLVGLCFVNKNQPSLNQQMIEMGWAFAAYHSKKLNFCDPQTIAKKNLQGIWAMQFTYPWEFRGSRIKNWC